MGDFNFLDGSNLGIPAIISRPSAAPTIGDPTIDTSDWGSTVGSLIGTGLSAWKSQLQADLLSQQIKAGQAPSIVAGPGGTPSAGFSYTTNPKTGAITYSAGGGTAGALAGASGQIFSSGLIWILLIAVVLVFALARR